MVSYIKVQGKLILIDQPEQSILENLESAGVDANYQCRDGFCGSCRCQLLSGTVSYQQIALGVLKAGEVLICIAKAESNIELKGICS
jgi:ferredoxin